MEDFVAYESRSFWAFLLIMAGVIFIIGLWTLGAFGAVPHPPGRSDREIFVVGWCFVIFSSFCGFLAFRSFMKPIEILRIGPQGIRFAKWSKETIPWSEITRVTIRDLRMYHGVTKAFVLYLRDPGRFPGRGLGRIAAESNTGKTGGTLAITLRDTNRSFADALSAVQLFKPVG